MVYCGFNAGYLFVTAVSTIFFGWVTQEILERYFGMAPQITTVNDIIKKAASNSHNPKKKFVLNMRLTKTLDVKGHYRIQTRGTINYIKAAWAFPIFVTSLVVFTTNREWFVDHFILLKPDSNCLQIYHHINVSILSLYLWELSANRYGKLDWPIICHHWLTIISCIFILLGRYIPFATWYGFIMVTMAFPCNFAFGLRATYSNKYPEFTRKIFSFCFWYWLCCIIICLSGQGFLIINSLIPSHFNGPIPVYFVCFMGISICGWAYDDYTMLKALYDFSTHDYEDADVLEQQGSHGMLGGRDLFALSMTEDIHTSLPKTIENLQLQELARLRSHLEHQIKRKNIGDAEAVVSNKSSSPDFNDLEHCVNMSKIISMEVYELHQELSDNHPAKDSPLALVVRRDKKHLVETVLGILDETIADTNSNEGHLSSNEDSDLNTNDISGILNAMDD